MSDIQVIAQFRALIQKFKDTEKQLLDAIKKRDFNASVFEAIDNIVIEIKEKLAGYDSLRVDDLSLRNDLTAIRENKDFFYFQLLELINKDHVGPNWDEFYANRWDDILHGEILSQVDPYELIIKRMELGTLLVGKDVPEHLELHLRKIKECYVWGFETEASIYCRTILEEGFREAFKPKPEFRTPQGKEDLKKWSLDWLINHARKKKYFYPEAIDRAYKIKENVNKIIHPSTARVPEEQLSNIDIIKDTFYVMEMLFR
jgi:hypothetical protein